MQDSNSQLNRLLQDVAARDVAALQSVCAQSANALYGLALSVVGDPDAAEQVLSDSFMTIWQTAGQADWWQMPAQSWLAEVTRLRAQAEWHRMVLVDTTNDNVPPQHLRQAQARHPPVWAATPWCSRQAVELADRLASMPADERMVLGWTFLRRENLAGVASHLKQSEEAARQLVRQCVSRLGAESPADQLAAGLVLGTLQGGAARRLQSLAQRHAGVRGRVLAWQTRLAGLGELHASAPAPSSAWEAVEQRLQAEQQHEQLASTHLAAQAKRAASVFQGAWWHSVGLWRSLAIALLICGVLAAGAGMSVYDMMNAHIGNLTKQLQKISKGAGSPGSPPALPGSTVSPAAKPQ